MQKDYQKASNKVMIKACQRGTKKAIGRDSEWVCNKAQIKDIVKGTKRVTKPAIEKDLKAVADQCDYNKCHL